MRHLMKYQFLQTIRGKDTMFWALLFPIILGTLFHFTFGTGATESELLKEIPVAVMIEDTTETGKAFERFLKELEGDALHIKKLKNESQAKDALLKGNILGIYYAGEQQSLSLSKTGLMESVLESILDTYIKNEAMVMDIIKNHPEKMPEAMEAMEGYKAMTKDVSLGGRTLDGTLQYFFALIAMACLYGCFPGMDTAVHLQANLSALGARRSVTPTHRMKLIVSDMVVTFGIHFFNIIVLLCYLKFILKVDFGDQWGYMLIVCLAGSIIGVAFGILIGSLGKKSENFKVAIMIGFSMICSFLAGLMIGGMKNLVEKHAPIINLINPAALISDAFYCVNVYDDMGRYYRNLGILFIMTLACVIASFLMVRRERYDSI